MQVNVIVACRIPICHRKKLQRILICLPAMNTFHPNVNVQQHRRQPPQRQQLQRPQLQLLQKHHHQKSQDINIQFQVLRSSELCNVSDSSFFNFKEISKWVSVTRLICTCFVNLNHNQNKMCCAWDHRVLLNYTSVWLCG